MTSTGWSRSRLSLSTNYVSRQLKILLSQCILTALALCYSAAEYACHVWGRFTHGKKMDVVLKMACIAITGCLKPTRVDVLYILCGIAPLSIRKVFFSQIARTRHESDPRHSLFQHEPAPKRLKSINSILHAVNPMGGKPHSCRIDDLSTHLQSRPHRMSRDHDESLPKGAREPRPTWQCLYRPRTGVGRCRHLM